MPQMYDTNQPGFPFSDQLLLALKNANTFAPQSVNSIDQNPANPRAMISQPVSPQAAANVTPPMTPSSNVGITPDNLQTMRLNNLYSPHTEATQAYLKAAQSLPDVNNYQPSRMRKIGAFIAGLGAGVGPAGQSGGQMIGIRTNPQAEMETSQAAALQPYDTQLTNAEQKLKPLQAAAQLEAEQNNQARMAAVFGERTIHDANTEANSKELADARMTLATRPTGSKVIYNRDGSADLIDNSGQALKH